MSSLERLAHSITATDVSRAKDMQNRMRTHLHVHRSCDSSHAYVTYMCYLIGLSHYCSDSPHTASHAFKYNDVAS